MVSILRAVCCMLLFGASAARAEPILANAGFFQDSPDNSGLVVVDFAPSAFEPATRGEVVLGSVNLSIYSLPTETISGSFLIQGWDSQGNAVQAQYSFPFTVTPDAGSQSAKLTLSLLGTPETGDNFTGTDVGLNLLGFVPNSGPSSDSNQLSDTLLGMEGYAVEGFLVGEGIFFKDYQKTDTTTPVEVQNTAVPPAVPEPSTLLLGSIAFGAWLIRRRKIGE